MNEGTIVKIKDLIGRKDVKGLLVDIRTRVDGKLQYDWETDPVIVKLKKVYWKHQKNHKMDNKKTKWLYWEWDTENIVTDSCGYSGISNPEEIEKYQLLVVDPNFKE